MAICRTWIACISRSLTDVRIHTVQHIVGSIVRKHMAERLRVSNMIFPPYQVTIRVLASKLSRARCDSIPAGFLFDWRPLCAYRESHHTTAELKAKHWRCFWWDRVLFIAVHAISEKLCSAIKPQWQGNIQEQPSKIKCFYCRTVALLLEDKWCKCFI